MIKATSLHFTSWLPLFLLSPLHVTVCCRHMQSICMGSLRTPLHPDLGKRYGRRAVDVRFMRAYTSLSGTAESQRYAGAASAQTTVLSGDFIRYNNETRYDEPALA